LLFEAFKQKYGYDKVINIATFKTLKPKASIQTAGRGLGYNNDDIQAIADMIPVERGAQWTLHECMYGDEETDKKPVKEFVNAVKDFPNLIESAMNMEGLIVGRSIHASGLYIYGDDYLNYVARMKSPNGEDITCWNMEDSDYVGSLKIDILTIEALDKIRTTMDLLIKDNKIEWQGSLKKTYDKYLHPDKLEYKSQDMYDLLFDGEVINAFQYETELGKQVLKKINARKLEEIIAGNSIMRLANKNGEQPLDRFVRMKSDISQWYNEMRDDWGLTQEEMEVLEKHLLKTYGVCDTQESLMMICMDENIAGFDLTQANMIRKAIAKKKPKLVDKSYKLFYEQGLAKCGTRKELLDYVWEVQIKPQLGYSFSVNHTTPYSIILIQEMNLCYLFGSMYWKCGCLSVNSGTTAEGKNADYGKIAKAVCEMNNIVDFPNINLSEEGFAINGDRILFGLRAINSVGDADIEIIKKLRPFTSYEDFIERTDGQIGSGAIANLIKSGAMDCLGDRREIMNKFLYSVADIKKSFTMSNIPMLIKSGILDIVKYRNNLNYYYLYKTVCTKENLAETPSGFRGKWYKLDNKFVDKFNEMTCLFLEEGKDYVFDFSYNGYLIKESSLKKLRDGMMDCVKKEVLTSSEVLEKFNESKVEEVKNKYADGDVCKWEMDSMNFYKTGHELDSVDMNRYSIKSFNDLNFDPVVSESYYTKTGNLRKRYKLDLICGTVLDSNKDKHTVTLLTTTGVVNVKMYAGAFNNYNKQVSRLNNETGKKTVIEKSWFKRGNKILVYGFRSGDVFIPRKYRDSIFNHTIMKISKVNKDGSIEVQMNRAVS